METGNRLFATVTNCDLTHSIEVLGPKTDLEIKNCDIKLPKARGLRSKIPTLNKTEEWVRLQTIAIIDEESIKDMVCEIRGQKVMLDFDLARIYGYETRAFNQQVLRNAERFPPEFRFKLSKEEASNVLRSHFVILEKTNGRGQHFKYLPYAFTEQGVYTQKGIE